jgi:hypothetical protein
MAWLCIAPMLVLAAAALGAAVIALIEGPTDENVIRPSRRREW